MKTPLLILGVLSIVGCIIFVGVKHFSKRSSSSISLSAEAQCDLGIAYLRGDGVEKNFSEGLNLLTLSANQGEVFAAWTLAQIYESGQYVTKNISEAIRFYAIASKGNIPEAQNRLAQFY